MIAPAKCRSECEGSTEMNVAVYLTHDTQLGRNVAPLAESMGIILIACNEIDVLGVELQHVEQPIVYLIEGSPQEIIHKVDCLPHDRRKAHVIAIASDASIEDVRAMMRREIADFLLMPAHPGEIMACLSRLTKNVLHRTADTQKALSMLSSMSSRWISKRVMTPNIDWEIIMTVSTFYLRGKEVHISELASILDVPLPTMRRKVLALCSRGLLDCPFSPADFRVYSIEPTPLTLLRIARLIQTKSSMQLVSVSE